MSWWSHVNLLLNWSGQSSLLRMVHRVVLFVELVRLCRAISCDHHHHHIVLAARISLTLSRHSSLSFIALGRSSGQQPVSSHSCWMYVRAGRPAFCAAHVWGSIVLAKSDQLCRQETEFPIEEWEQFMVLWGIPLCTSGLLHCIDRHWLFGSKWKYFII